MKFRMALGAMAIVAAGAVAVAPAQAQRRHHHGGWGWGAGAGFAAGALLGSAIASSPRYYRPGYYYEPGYAYEPGPAYVVGSDDAYCSRRYRSYDPASGTYLGYDGHRHPCP